MRRERPVVHWLAHHMPDVFVVLLGIYFLLLVVPGATS